MLNEFCFLPAHPSSASASRLSNLSSSFSSEALRMDGRSGSEAHEGGGPLPRRPLMMGLRRKKNAHFNYIDYRVLKH